jgi:hypothetical protein
MAVKHKTFLEKVAEVVPLIPPEIIPLTKSEIEAVLTGVITSHSHEGGGGGLTQQQIEGFI